MYEKHWGFNYNDDDCLMHYGIKGMKWKNHVYKKYDKLKKRFKHIFGSKSSKKKKTAAKEKVSPEIKQLRSELDAAFGKPIKLKKVKDYSTYSHYDTTDSLFGFAGEHGKNFKQFYNKNLPELLGSKEFLNWRKTMSNYIAQAYPNDPKKRRQLTINMNNYIQNQASDILIEAWGTIMTEKSKSVYLPTPDGGFVAEEHNAYYDFEDRAKKHYGNY